MFVLQVNSKVFFIQSLHVCPRVTEMGSTHVIGHIIDYHGVEALRGQQHIPSYLRLLFSFLVLTGRYFPVAEFQKAPIKT